VLTWRSFPRGTLTGLGEVIRPVTAVLTSGTSSYGVFPLVGRLARLGCTLGGSPRIFGVPTP
jgi:hypothetical protein